MASTRTPNEPDGEVVYRRLDAPDQTPPPSRGQSRIDPALIPLVVGFAILLLLVLLLGNLSVRRLEETSSKALQMEQTHLARTQLLWNLRVALTRLDNEARDRMVASARREIRPPFDLRLDTTRNQLNDQLQTVERAQLGQVARWQSLRDKLVAYIDATRDSNRYTLEGYARFRDVDSELSEFIRESNNEQARILDEADALEKAATKSIRTWNVIALLAGLIVAIATIWQVQRRFQQTRQSTDAARREREFSNQMLEGMVSAIAAIDRQDRIRSANTAFLRIFPRAAIGSSIHDQVASPDGVKLLEAATASHVDRATYRGRWNVELEGSPVTFAVYSSPLAIDDEHGQILTLVDVTEATKAEAALRRTESLAAVGSAAAQLAHEIKNPLGSIRLGVEMLRQYTDNEEAEKTISLVERGIHHLNKLVVDVTQFSRRRDLELGETDLHDVIESSIELVMDRVRDKETPIITNLDPHMVEGNWDSEQLREVLVNLVGNAIDASAARSPVEISTQLMSADGSPRSFDAPRAPETVRARLMVKDHGAGMDPKTQARLFEPFFTTKKRGTGLGLSIVRQIIDLHGGTIEVESEKGKGTTFTIELPVAAVGLERWSVSNKQ
jgi:two-component system, NtrC family, nitrogen regulation sensor histidine kinase GlnL